MLNMKPTMLKYKDILVLDYRYINLPVRWRSSAIQQTCDKLAPLLERVTNYQQLCNQNFQSHQKQTVMTQDYPTAISNYSHSLISSYLKVSFLPYFKLITEVPTVGSQRLLKRFSWFRTRVTSWSLSWRLACRSALSSTSCWAWRCAKEERRR